MRIPYDQPKYARLAIVQRLYANISLVITRARADFAASSLRDAMSIIKRRKSGIRIAVV